MSFSRVKPAGWSTGEVLTSAQMNTLDTDHANAIDGRVGALEIASRQVTRFLPLATEQRPQASWDNSADSWYPKTLVTTVADLLFHFTIPNGATLDSVSISISPNTGHGGLPGTMPVLRVYRIGPTGSTLLGSTTDSSGSVGAYEASHSITVASIAHVADTTANSFMVRFSSEGGANAVDELLVDGVTITFTTIRLDEW